MSLEVKAVNCKMVEIFLLIFLFDLLNTLYYNENIFNLLETDHRQMLTKERNFIMEKRLNYLYLQQQYTNRMILIGFIIIAGLQIMFLINKFICISAGFAKFFRYASIRKALINILCFGRI